MLASNRVRSRPRPPIRSLGWWSHGVLIALDVEPSLVAAVRRVLPPGRAIAPPETPHRRFVVEHDASGFTLRRDGRRLQHGLARTDLLDALASAVQLTVATLAPDLLFVHAGVVAWRGRALVIPGRSTSGKSTLVAALVRAGATYYSDEYALFDASGRVHPFARPLRIRRARGVTRVDPQKLGAPVGRRPLPVALVLSCRYRAHVTARLAPLTPGQTVLALLRHTVAARTRPIDALDRLSMVAKRARALYGVRGEARSMAERLLAELT
jgi:hypothetical protein